MFSFLTKKPTLADVMAVVARLTSETHYRQYEHDITILNRGLDWIEFQPLINKEEYLRRITVRSRSGPTREQVDELTNVLNYTLGAALPENSFEVTTGSRQNDTVFFSLVKLH